MTAKTNQSQQEIREGGNNTHTLIPSQQTLTTQFSLAKYFQIDLGNLPTFV